MKVLCVPDTRYTRAGRDDLITAELRKSGNSFIVIVPRDEIERPGLREGRLVLLDVRPAEVRPLLAADLLMPSRSNYLLALRDYDTSPSRQLL
jgi:hypothetical protein